MRILHVHNVAYVAETLVKALCSLGVDAIFVEAPTKEAVAWADIVHAHYALNRKTLRALAYARRMAKPFVLHHHGSDVRVVTAHEMRPLPMHYAAVSRYVRRRSAHLFLATPDLTRFSEGEYIPNPVDIELFHPMNVPKTDRVLICGRQVKDSRLPLFIDAKKEYDCINTGYPLSLPKNVRLCPVVPRPEFPIFLNRYKMMIGAIGDLITMARLEAMSCGLRTFSDFDPSYCDFYGGTNPDTVEEPRGFAERYHDPVKSARRLIQVYETLL
ncbi:MAG: hypothetical protein AB1665_04595 [Candidatus Thermoplasmatota archaeon]